MQFDKLMTGLLGTCKSVYTGSLLLHDVIFVCDECDV